MIIAARDVSDPVVLASSLARSVGGIVLGEAGEEPAGVEHGALSEVAAAMCGFGVLLTSGACVYTKSCGGLRAHRATHLDVASHATALALFLRLHDVKPGAARRHLEFDAARGVRRSAAVGGLEPEAPRSAVDSSGVAGRWSLPDRGDQGASRATLRRQAGARPRAGGEDGAAGAITGRRATSRGEQGARRAGVAGTVATARPSRGAHLPQ